MVTRISEETRTAIAAVYDKILLDVADGKPIGASIVAHGFTPSVLRAYRDGDKGAADQWESARIQSADALADEILATAYNTELDAQHARTRVDSLKWMAAKRNPRQYSDKAQLEVNVRQVDLTQIILAANARLSASRMQSIEGESVRVPAENTASALLADLIG